ncbi:hypothetical protein ACOSQ2_014111 [Xanthoceras sorbifolium]
MERFLFTKLSMLIVIALVLQMHGYKDCLEKERTALLEIKAFYINSFSLESWVDDKVSDCCDWDYIGCNTTTGQVVNLSLSVVLDKHNSYPPPCPILNFSMFEPFEELQGLGLASNSLEGFVGSRESLKQLKILDLRYNYFNNSILSCLTTLTSLNTLLLKGNNLEDSNMKQGIELANLRNLEVLDLSFTRITSTAIANLRNLKFLNLCNNAISGTLQELGNIYYDCTSN